MVVQLDKERASKLTIGRSEVFGISIENLLALMLFINMNPMTLEIVFSENAENIS